jgi:hypothetical protein
VNLPEALQPPERFATTSEAAESPSPSPEVNGPILIESDQEQVKGKENVGGQGATTSAPGGLMTLKLR